MSKDNILKITRKALGIILYLLLAMVIIGVIYSVMQTNNDKTVSILNHRLCIVQSGSMTPTIKVGSLIFIKESVSQVEEGDIITFQKKNQSMPTTHRIISSQNENGMQYITRGDANNTDDPLPVHKEEIIGKVVLTIPYVGYVIGFLKSRVGVFLLLVVPGIILLLTQIISLVNDKKDKKEDSEFDVIEEDNEYDVIQEAAGGQLPISHQEFAQKG